MNQNIIFGDAAYKTHERRQATLRPPENLPKESECQHMRDYTLKRLAEITDNEYGGFILTHFTELRDLVVSRLTLFNARWGGEPARLTLNEWDEAENRAWLNSETLEQCDKVEKKLSANFKLTYQAGKRNNHLVPIIFDWRCDRHEEVSRSSFADFRWHPRGK